MINSPLFVTSNIRLTAIDPEKDAPVESRWTHDPDYARLLDPEVPARPTHVKGLKERYEKCLKRSEETHNEYYFAVRRREDEETVGFLRIPFIAWSHDTALLKLSFGDASALQRYGQETLTLALVYMFGELNLFRVIAAFPEYAEDYIDLFRQSGFVLEIRQREYIFGRGHTWDNLRFALLRDEWAALAGEVS